MAGRYKLSDERWRMTEDIIYPAQHASPPTTRPAPSVRPTEAPPA